MSLLFARYATNTQNSVIDVLILKGIKEKYYTECCLFVRMAAQRMNFRQGLNVHIKDNI
jgi:hypothetical protein